tara:strand:- start:2401 stop:2628 length:228 start_codon:yes stop_codon:yes gene_type:complete
MKPCVKLYYMFGSTLELVENMVLVRLKYQWRKGQEHFKTEYQAPLSVIQLGGRFLLPDLPKFVVEPYVFYLTTKS